ncbi:hypothetical protein SAMN05444166_6272 [Singulisphaera sp. GP187]|uniref:hypothetical protein n=1 Tax=Singulisphaera sp. GP187 TaxID=1882752 RepID=UPI00092B38DF|nr:hypothetical protein [Singulisphaera sp. GP187]SIO60115.1 hypothetical protein SAMN05444166_6272 [Singulisphaera sp. GP187]
MKIPLTTTRRGITLLEILISILIMGVGMTSIMTLFPIGLLNLRQANRYSRSRYLAQSAFADMRAENLLAKSSFIKNPATAPWYTTPIAARAYDPWMQDTPDYGSDPWAAPFGVYRGDGPPTSTGNTIGPLVGYGFPVAYDPLWRSATGLYPDPKTTPEYRFGSGIGFVRNDPDGSLGSVHGLPRVTNFPAWTTANVPGIFVSPEDIVLQSASAPSKSAGSGSSIVPDMQLGTNAVTGMASVQNDWKFTWMFTGRQSMSTEGDRFDGDIVIFENRPFAANPIVAPFDATVKTAVAGETVVEAIYGYTGHVTSVDGKVGYGSTAKRVVLLRWSDKVPDPEIRVGDWFADVTYERAATVERQRMIADPIAGKLELLYPYQRCHWYRIAKRTQPNASTTLPGYRELTVWTINPLYAFTLLDVATGDPIHVNAALISPYVVNVYPRTIYAR